MVHAHSGQVRMLRNAIVLLLLAHLFLEVSAAPIPLNVRADAGENKVGEEMLLEDDEKEDIKEERRDGGPEVYAYTLPATQSDLDDSTTQGNADEDQSEMNQDQGADQYDKEMGKGPEVLAPDDGVKERGLIQDSVSFLTMWLWILAVLFVVVVCVGTCMIYRLLNRYGDNLPMKEILSKYKGYEGAMQGFM